MSTPFVRDKQRGMGKGAPNLKLRAWRASRGYSMEEAAGKVVVDGQPCTKATWHGWESAGKIPKPEWMLPLCELTGLQPNDFYVLPVAGPSKPTVAGGGNSGSAPARPKRGGTKDGGEPPQMALLI